MRLGFLSDVHAHPDRLELALDRLIDEGAELLVCLGDIVGYGPDPCAAVDMVADRCNVVLRGNHDHAVAEGSEHVSFAAESARAGAENHRALLGERRCRWLADLPVTAEVEGLGLVHASIPQPLRWRYPVVGTIADDESAMISIDAVFRAMGHDVLLVGHSHVPAVFALAPDRAPDVEPPGFTWRRLERGWRFVVDVGSVSLPRQRSVRSAVLVDTARCALRHLDLGR